MQRADHIKVYSKLRRVWSHGIACGDGSVIYYEDLSPKSTETVRQIPLKIFAKSERVVICDDRNVLKPSEVVRRAQGLLGVKCLRDLEDFSSENFALWCKCGCSGNSAFDGVLDALLTAAHQTARLSARASHVHVYDVTAVEVARPNPAFIEDVLQ